MSNSSAVLHEPWPDLRLQREGVSLGIWTFLASEVLFFGGLFVGYAVYRSFNAEAFRIAASNTAIVYGTINTVLLLTSSMTMTIALRAATVGLRRVTLVLLLLTVALGLAFLVTKGWNTVSTCKSIFSRGQVFRCRLPRPSCFGPITG